MFVAALIIPTVHNETLYGLSHFSDDVFIHKIFDVLWQIQGGGFRLNENL